MKSKFDVILILSENLTSIVDPEFTINNGIRSFVLSVKISLKLSKVRKDPGSFNKIGKLDNIWEFFLELLLVRC